MVFEVLLGGLGSLVMFLLVSIVPIAIAGYLSWGCNKNTVGWYGFKKWIFIIFAALTWPYYIPYYVTFHYVFSDYAFCPPKNYGLSGGDNSVEISV